MIATAELGETTSMPSFLLRSMNVTQTGARGDKNGRAFSLARNRFIFSHLIELASPSTDYEKEDLLIIQKSICK